MMYIEVASGTTSHGTSIVCVVASLLVTRRTWPLPFPATMRIRDPTSASGAMPCEPDWAKFTLLSHSAQVMLTAVVAVGRARTMSTSPISTLLAGSPGMTQSGATVIIPVTLSNAVISKSHRGAEPSLASAIALIHCPIQPSVAPTISATWIWLFVGIPVIWRPAIPECFACLTFTRTRCGLVAGIPAGRV